MYFADYQIIISLYNYCHVLREKWVEIFNTGNDDKITELYHKDAINHQVCNEPIIDRIGW